jgi:Na+-transporting methylmalonyl-CoA/oxaloacetate decarboxylase gamma subunit
MFWAFLALMGTVALAVLSLLIWPIRVLMRRIRGAPPEEAQPPADPSDVGATSEDVNRTTTSR